MATRKRKFTDLSNRIVDGVTGDPQLERMRAYLVEWGAWRLNHRPSLGAAGSFMAKFLKSESPTASELLGVADHWTGGLIEASLDDLASQENGVLMAAAIRCRYLKEGMDGMRLRIIKGGEIVAINLMEADRLADEGERALISLCRKRGLLV